MQNFEFLALQIEIFMDYHNADRADCFCSNTDFGYGICNNSDLGLGTERNHCLVASMLKRNSPELPCSGVAAF